MFEDEDPDAEEHGLRPASDYEPENGGEWDAPEPW